MHPLMKKIVNFLKHPWVRNRYVITSFCFIVWMLFFDQYDLISQIQERRTLQSLEEDKKYYIDEIKKAQQDLDELVTNTQKLEKFAREKYLMKMDDEEVFVIVEK